ncbi:hypothetical protein [Mesorhizobium sp. M00.F.Ca.ET.217.01.1.1]|uniref:hypothetical protein n=1 Tax=Mesorhizobium sp. M00.F.Ca.ET.217.01.1.1 TaxID=2500529 RepID=UPI000FD9BE1E|nr:hypothetical protein [Mesorhizobium sp. M00.F.Ca.ET.217.01.1.1]TGQ19350.1 hypothetical protein EN860_019675 [Mesorhizobium sp. M00.F.Ca.ET.217.01.1.1]
MTCIAGLVDNGKVFIGGDSAAYGDDAVEVRANRKVFRNGEYLIGFTGSFRVGQLLQFATGLPAPKPRSDLLGHIVTELIGPIKQAVDKETAADILIGCRGRLFKVCTDYNVAEYPTYAAAGQGERYALGRLHGSLGPPEQRLVAALAAAEAHSAAVRAPFYVEVV